MKATHPMARFLQGFFHEYLAAQRGLSLNTILSYRDALKLLLRFGSDRMGKPIDELALEDLDEKMVLAFLDDLETTRGNSTETRNNRLAALRTFMRYLAYQDPMLLPQCQRICALPSKHTQHKIVEYLEDDEIGALLKRVDLRSRNGSRDYALLLFLYNTGARVQEAVDLKLDDLRLERPFQVKLTGKGRKERVCPLWPETVAALQNYLHERERESSPVPSVFLNANGQPITRFGIRYLVRRDVALTVEACPSLKCKKISPHSIRHTTAMHLLQAGNDLSVVKDWLGHADLNTTHAYVEIDMKMKRRALEASQPPDIKAARKGACKWLKPSVLEWLDGLSKTAKIMCSAAPSPATPGS
jgi:site-specific recombinase XerD